MSYWVDVPHRDQWRIARFLIQAYENGLSLSELFSQHNDSRTFFPRLLFYALSKLGHWDVRREMLITFFLACGCSVLLNSLARRTLPVSTNARWAIVIGFNLFLFSPAQHQNWLWGIQLICLIPVFFLLLGFWIQSGTRSASSKVWLSALCCVVATFSYANGLALWPLLGLSLWLEEKDSASRKKSLLAYSALAVTTLYFFFHHYYRQRSPLPYETSDIAIFFLSWCGASLYPKSVSMSLSLGSVLFATWAWFAASALRKDKTQRKLALPWLLLGLYAVTAGLACAWGRSHEGLTTALKSKYITFSIYLPLSLAALLVLESAKDKSRRFKDPSWPPAVAFLALALFVYGINFPRSVREMAVTRAERLNGRQAIREIWEHHPSPRPAQLGRSDAEIRELTFPLVRLGLLKAD